MGANETIAERRQWQQLTLASDCAVLDRGDGVSGVVGVVCAPASQLCSDISNVSIGTKSRGPLFSTLLFMFLLFLCIQLDLLKHDLMLLKVAASTWTFYATKRLLTAD